MESIYAVRKDRVFRIEIDRGKYDDRIIGVRVRTIAYTRATYSYNSKTTCIGKNVVINDGKVIVTGRKTGSRTYDNILGIFSERRKAVAFMNLNSDVFPESEKSKWDSEIKKTIQSIGKKHPFFVIDSHQFLS